MLTSERKALIQQVLKQDGRLVAKEFSQRLGESFPAGATRAPSTVR